ncbi:MAG: cytochrome ubiquinol oxidase subunit I [Candidatus Kapaibacteriales bacterium]
MGRQPWIVYGILKTSDSFSKNLPAGNVWFSLILFTLIYLLILVLFLFLLDRKIKQGPVEPVESDLNTKQKTIFQRG